jgi:hypothetical protein
MTAHHPSQRRLQNATIRAGSAVLRRIPLHGLAWRSQVVSSILNSRAIVLSRVICCIIQFFVNNIAIMVDTYAGMLPAIDLM